MKAQENFNTEESLKLTRITKYILYLGVYYLFCGCVTNGTTYDLGVTKGQGVDQTAVRNISYLTVYNLEFYLRFRLRASLGTHLK